MSGAAMAGDNPKQTEQQVELSPKDQVLNILKDGGKLWDQPVTGYILILDKNGEPVQLTGIEQDWQLRQLVTELKNEKLIEQTSKSEHGGHMILRTSFRNPAFKYTITDKAKAADPQS